MSTIAQAIRHKRFKFIEEAPVDITVETPMGETIKLRPVDISLNGLAGFVSAQVVSLEQYADGSIFPACKLSWKDKEFALGRVVLRRVDACDEGVKISFSTIDAKLPVRGELSRYLKPSEQPQEIESDFDQEMSPEKFNLATFMHSDEGNIDLFQKCKQFSVFFKDWQHSKKFQYHTVRTASKGARVNLTERRPDGRNDYLGIGTYDYLGLSNHPSVIKAAQDAMEVYGISATGSLLLTGLTVEHEKLAELIASLLRQEKAMVFSSGYAANIGTISGLISSSDLMVGDMLAHASLRDGMQLAQGTARFFKHNNMDHLEKILSGCRDDFAGSLIITEGVFSMDGDIAPLPEIVNMAQKYRSRVFLDEAHSIGTMGERGLGLTEKFGLDVDLIMGSLSKGPGVMGGFLAGSKAVIDWLYYYGRSFMFSGGIPPALAAAARVALTIMVEDPEPLQRLRENIRHFVKGLRQLRWDIDKDHESPVIPVVIGDEHKLGIMNAELKRLGVYAVPVVYPAVSRKNCRFRFSLTAEHTISELDYVLAALERAMEKAERPPDLVVPF